MSFDFLTLIRDRTQADTDRAEYLNGLRLEQMTDEERTEFESGLKGTYNAEDLNRVGAAVRYLTDRLRQFGFVVSTEPKTNWTDQDWPTPAQMKRFLSDLAELRYKLAVPQETPDAPAGMGNLDWQTANQIEQILWDLETVLNAAQSIQPRAGQPLLFCGSAIYVKTKG